MILGPFCSRLGSFTLSMWVVGGVFSVSVMSINCSSVGYNCARTSVSRSVGCHSDI